MVAFAIAAGKITPAQKEWAEAYALTDPEGFRLFVAKAPVVVPLGDLKTGGPKPAGSIDDAQLQINKMMGISDEVWKKHNPPAQA
ncbi:MAG: phage protease [Desulfobacteraceae bacterium]|nr:phage protease [Desulfobacteraceae bacterium]